MPIEDLAVDSGFLRGGGNSVKPDVREKDISSTCTDSAESERRKAVPVGAPVGGANIATAQGQHKKDYRNFDHHDCRIEAALSLMPTARIAVITSAITNAGRLKPISIPKTGAFTRS